ncbi:fimbrial assembly protein [Zhengella mangrovi]|uniref:Fimbrial assembly protein n=1 Tax=Zhengella mangrovi TaxID=1982044 RepID=A0A2G1QGC9_9HYPH|nr:fimbria/pilus outer membrane usher protein [Zhengella mangrovi]PHP64583.1 fimbrial assembly protein [Zhengella mangrovi]
MDLQSKVRHRSKLRNNRAHLLLVCLTIAVFCPLEATSAPSGSQALFLEVYVNDQPTGLIAEFAVHPDKRISIETDEWHELSMKIPQGAKTVYLDQIENLSYRYDEANQTISIQTSVENRTPQKIDARPSSTKQSDAQSSTGVVVNYALTAAGQTKVTNWDPGFNGISATLNSRLFTPYGIAELSAIGSSDDSVHARFLRLNTNWIFDRPATATRYKVGDLVSGSLPWNRSVRMAGFQVQREFQMRPDLVTIPLPSFSGSAAVPSTIDVYINNSKTFSQQINPGPFEISNIPIINGIGTARMVLRDSSGRTTETDLPFNAPANMLRRGLLDFSIEAGVARRNYGTKSNDYDDQPIASGTLRYGLRDSLTVESHFEASPHLVNAGLGAVMKAGQRGTLSVAGSASSFNGKLGAQLYAALDLDYAGWKLRASTHRTAGDFNDLASVTASDDTISAAPSPYIWDDTPLAIDTISVYSPTILESGSISFGYIHSEYRDRKDGHLLNASYSHSLRSGMSLNLSSFYDFGYEKRFGVFAGLTMAFDGNRSSSITASSDNDRLQVAAQYSKAGTGLPGSTSWQVATAASNTVIHQAAGTYYGENATARAGIYSSGKMLNGELQLDGAVVANGGDIFLAPQVDDAFAIVDTSLPGVEILYENRPVGKTNARGKKLITGLRSYQPNRISLDPTSLPVDADLKFSEVIIQPRYKSGVDVDFNVSTTTNSALVVLKSIDGAHIPAGSTGTLSNGGGSFIVGYDGQAFIENLSQLNIIDVQTKGGDCRAAFKFTPNPGTQNRIDNVVCK